MKKRTARALIISVVTIELAAATAAVAGASSLPPKCSTELVGRCGQSIECLRVEVAKVKTYCRAALLDNVLPASFRRD